MFIGILFITGSGTTESYKTGIGPRFCGPTSGVTVKHFNSTTSAIEGMLPADRQCSVMPGLYNDHRLYTTSTVAGTQSIPGMAYTFKNSPVQTDPEFKPFIDFFNGSTAYFDGGLGLR